MQNLSEKLTACGMRRTLALVVEVLSDNEWHKFRDIERKADLRQPEVSQAVKEIKEYIEIQKCEERQFDHGRCMQKIRITKPKMDEFTLAFIQKKEKEIDEIRALLTS